MVCLQPSGAVLKPDVSAEGEANEAKNLEGQVLGKKICPDIMSGQS